VSGIIVFPLFYLIELFAVSWLIPGIWLKITVLFLMPLTGKLAFKWYIVLRKTTGLFRIINLRYFKTKNYRHLVNLKDRLFTKLDSVITISQYIL